MDVEKYQQYVKSRLRAAEMRKEIHDHLDKFKTARQMGYEAAKIKYKPLLEAQKVQTEAQKEQIAATKELVSKPATEVEQIAKLLDEDLSTDARLFLHQHTLPLPSNLYREGVLSRKEGGQKFTNWKQNMVDISENLTQTLKKTDISTEIKKSAAEYKEQLIKVAKVVTQKTAPPAGPPEGLPTGPPIGLPAAQPAVVQTAAPMKATPKKSLLFDKDLNINTIAYLDDNNYLLPSTLHHKGIQADKEGRRSQWRKDMHGLLQFLEDKYYKSDPDDKESIGEYQDYIRNVIKQFPEIGTPNFNNDLTVEDIQFIKDNKYPMPQEIFEEGLNIKLNYSNKVFAKWVSDHVDFRDSLADANKGKVFRESRKKYYLLIEKIIGEYDNVVPVSGTGLKRGGNIFMNPQDLFKKLELITGSIIAGNTSKK